MDLPQKIEFLQPRTISNMIADTINFIRANFKSLFSGLFFVYFKQIMRIMNNSSSDSSFSLLFGNVLISVGSSMGYILYSFVFIGICFLYYSFIESRIGIKAKKAIDSIGEKEI